MVERLTWDNICNVGAQRHYVVSTVLKVCRVLTSAAHILKNRNHKKKPDRIAETQEYNNWTEKFKRVLQANYCPKQRISKLKDRLFQIILFEEQIKYWWETWTIKKAEHQRIDAFELWFWRRLLQVPWTFKRSNQSVLKEIIPEYSLKGLMQKSKLHISLATWCEEPTH